jgi:hypothetical protein
VPARLPLRLPARGGARTRQLHALHVLLAKNLLRARGAARQRPRPAPQRHAQKKRTILGEKSLKGRVGNAGGPPEAGLSADVSSLKRRV